MNRAGYKRLPDNGESLSPTAVAVLIGTTVILCIGLALGLGIGLGSKTQTRTVPVQCSQTHVTGYNVVGADLRALQHAVDTYDIVTVSGVFDFGKTGQLVIRKSVTLTRSPSCIQNPVIKGGYYSLYVNDTAVDITIKGIDFDSNYRGPVLIMNAHNVHLHSCHIRNQIAANITSETDIPLVQSDGLTFGTAREFGSIPTHINQVIITDCIVNMGKFDENGILQDRIPLDETGPYPTYALSLQSTVIPRMFVYTSQFLYANRAALNLPSTSGMEFTMDSCFIETDPYASSGGNSPTRVSFTVNHFSQIFEFTENMAPFNGIYTNNTFVQNADNSRFSDRQSYGFWLGSGAERVVLAKNKFVIKENSALPVLLSNLANPGEGMRNVEGCELVRNHFEVTSGNTIQRSVLLPFIQPAAIALFSSPILPPVSGFVANTRIVGNEYVGITFSPPPGAGPFAVTIANSNTPPNGVFHTTIQSQSAHISDASGDGTNVVYQSTHTFVVGKTVNVTGTGAFDVVDAPITSITDGSFTISSSQTGAFSGYGIAVVSKDYADVATGIMNVVDPAYY